ncbi:MAG: hypothetical protein F6K09_05860, partial [Merismopedia sp. SIO2A8]|nr:hypothetical protein [Merismopedia sp. SIO2A8]
MINRLVHHSLLPVSKRFGTHLCGITSAILAVSSPDMAAIELGDPNHTRSQPTTIDTTLAAPATMTTRSLNSLKQFFAQNPPPPGERRPRRRLGVRGSLCAVSPGLLEPQNIIWSDRPLFLWRSDPQFMQIQRLEVIDADGRIIWDKPLPPTTQHVIYDGPALQSGEFYTWQLTWVVDEREQTMDYAFQLMDSEMRQRILTDLDTLSQPTEQATLSEEAIALRYADYFIDAELWSDAMQVLYTIESPSA